MEPFAVVARDPRVLFRDTAGGVVILGPDDTQSALATGSAHRLWQMLESPCTREALIEVSAAESGLAAGAAEVLVDEGLASLAGHVTCDLSGA